LRELVQELEDKVALREPGSIGLTLIDDRPQTVLHPQRVFFGEVAFIDQLPDSAFFRNLNHSTPLLTVIL